MADMNDSAKVGTIKMRNGALGIYPHIVVGGVPLRILDFAMEGQATAFGTITVTMRLTDFDAVEVEHQAVITHEQAVDPLIGERNGNE